MLTPLADDPTVVTTPVIDVIDTTNFAAKAGSVIFVGVVEFPTLEFGWRMQPPRELLRRHGDDLEPVR